MLLSPLVKGHGPSFENTWITFSQGCFVPNLVDIGSGEEDFKVCQYIITLLLLTPLGKEPSSSFEKKPKLESPSPKDALYQVWLKLAQWFWRRRRKCEKWMTTMLTTMLKTDNNQIVVRKAHLSLRFVWARKGSYE